jgi:hypothetical protein
MKSPNKCAVLVATFRTRAEANKAYRELGDEISEKRVYLLTRFFSRAEEASRARNSGERAKKLTARLKDLGALKIERYWRYQELEINVQVPTKLSQKVVPLVLSKDDATAISSLYHLCGKPKTTKDRLTFKYRGQRIRFLAHHPHGKSAIDCLMLEDGFIEVPPTMTIKIVRDY